MRPPRGLPTNNEFLRFSTTRFISRSLTLLSMRHRTVAGEDVQLLPLIQRVVHRLGHRVLGQQLIPPGEELVLERRQDRHRLAPAEQEAFFVTHRLAALFDGVEPLDQRHRLGLSPPPASVVVRRGFQGQVVLVGIVALGA